MKLDAKTTLPLLSILTAFALQACAAPTGDATGDAPANDAVTNDAVGAEGDLAASAAKLSGAFGTPEDATMQAAANVVAGSEAKAGSTATTQLLVKATGATYDVFSYEFGMVRNADSAIGSAREVAAPTLSPLSVSMKASSLAKLAFTGKTLGTVILRSRDAYGKMVDVAAFDGASVISVQSSAAGNELLESYTLSMHAVRVNSETGWVKYDVTTNVATCSQNCPCNGDLPGFVQSSQSTDLIAKDSVRVDSVSVGVSGSPLSLDGIGVSGSVAKMGICALYDVATGSHPASAHIAVAAPAASTWQPKPRESTSWEACGPLVTAVSFAGGYDGSANETVTLDATGLVRTDRTFDAYGTEISSSSFGWSFARNIAIASCGAGL